MKLPINEIKINPDNPRTIKDENFKKLVQSVQDFPEMTEIRPIVVNKDHMILGGNMRFQAMQAAGWSEVPVKVVDLTPEQEKEFIIKDNVSGGDWDWEALANQWDMTQLEDWGLEIEWDEEQTEIIEDDAPELAEEHFSEQGKVYQLGRHYVMCGSATEQKDVEQLLGTEKVNLLYTDPPYGVEYHSNKLGSIQNDDLKNDELFQFIYDAFEIIHEYLETDAGVYCWYEDKFRNIIQPALQEAGYEYKQNLIWNKGMNLSGADYQKAHENCLYLQLKDSKAQWFGDRDKKTILGLRRRELTEMKKSELLNMILNMQKQQTVWDFDRDSTTTYTHPTQKPVTLAANAIYNSTNPDQVVLDLFAGSGSTLIASEQTDRQSYNMELDPKFVDVIRKRYAKFINPDTWEERWQELTPEVR